MDLDIFDLFFIVLFLSAAVALGIAGVAAVSGNGPRARRIFWRVAIGFAVYMGIVCVESLATRQRILNIGDPQCNGEWCIAVAGVERAPTSSGISYSVSLRLSSRARRVAQQENGVIVYLTDAQGRRFDPVPNGHETPLNVLIGPGESVEAVRVFELPSDARDVGLVVDHKSGLIGCFPGCFVVTENNWFHKLPVVRLE